LRRFCKLIVLSCCLALPQIGLGQVADLSVDDLVKQLADSDVNRRRDAAYELVRRQDSSETVVLAFATATADSDIQVRFQSLMGLARSGEAAKPAINALVRCLADRDDQIRFRAADALGKIGVASLQPILDKWPNGSVPAKVAASQAMEILGPEAKPAIPVLTEALKEKGDLARFAAAAMVAISPDDEAAILPLARHEDRDVRRVGIAAVALFGNPSDAATQVMRDAVRDDDPKVREAAVIALAKSHLAITEKEVLIEAGLLDEVGSVRAAAVVAMRKAFTSQASAKKGFAERVAGKLKDASSGSAMAIVKALGSMGPDARSTFPQLLDWVSATRQDEAKAVDEEFVAQTFANFGSEVVPDLLVAIEQRPEIEPILSLSLGKIGEPAVGALVEALESDRELIRLAATRALGGIRPLNDMMLVRLSKLSEDPSARIRGVAIGSLITAGVESEALNLTLINAMQDSAPSVRAEAIRALPLFSFTDPQIQTAISDALNDEDADVRVNVLETLLQFGGDQLSKRLTTNRIKIIELVADDQPGVRLAAVAALGQLGTGQLGSGTDGEAVENAIVLALADSETAVRIAATRAVVTLGLKNERVLKMVSANLVDDLDLLRVSLDAIGGFGHAGKELIPITKDLLGHEQSDVRIAVMDSLAAIDPDQKDLADSLAGLLDDQEWDVRRQAGVQLGKLGPVAINAVPKLFGLLASEQDSDFASAALKEINTAPVDAIPLLLAKIDSEERRVGFYAITLLGKIGPPAREALPKLEALLEKPDAGGRGDFRRRFIREAIDSIKSGDSEK
jgi:HEAT repeat protein